MEFLILFGILLSITAWRFRLALWTQGFGWKRFASFTGSLLFAILALHDGLLGACRNEIETQAAIGTAGTPSTIDFISIVSHAYRDTDFLLAICGFIAVIELCAYLASGKALNRRPAPPAVITSSAIMSRWWANIIILIGAPAFAFLIASFSPAHPNYIGLNSVAENLHVLIWAYYAPVQALGMSIHDRGLIGFTRATPPWVVLSLVMTVLPLFGKTTSAPQDRHDVMQYLLGTTHLRSLWRSGWLRSLPWRGRYLLAYCTVSGILALTSPLLNALGDMVILFVYNLIWIGPALLILGILLIASKVTNRK